MGWCLTALELVLSLHAPIVILGAPAIAVKKSCQGTIQPGRGTAGLSDT